MSEKLVNEMSEDSLLMGEDSDEDAAAFSAEETLQCMVEEDDYDIDSLVPQGNQASSSLAQNNESVYKVVVKEEPEGENTDYGESQADTFAELSDDDIFTVVIKEEPDDYDMERGGPSAGGQFLHNTMPRRKDICNDLREAIVAAHQSGKGYKAISKQFKVHHSTVRKIIYKWKTFKTVANLPRSGRPSKFTPRSDRAMLREIAKKPRVTSQTLQASVSMLNVKVHNSTIRKRLNKYDLC
ncbi:uncharacterized protein LOC128666737 isoform X3 [Bombina bombina]|uniref:uncharacterized protein LOC128666737 isoform X3 n=1 Tax=Bombina bombina TaxID=8345 RepID=UPI00235B0005|nr:uncharacterized protein LOC128666737 isoform X3 [Bombina bombina]